MDTPEPFPRQRPTTPAKRKILVISGTFPPTRVAESDHVLHLCRRLGERGLDIEVLTTKGSANGAGLPFRVLPIMASWDWTELPRLMRAIKDAAPDVVFLYFAGHLFNFHPMVTLVPAIVRRTAPDTRLVTQLTCTIGSRSFLLPLPTRVAWKALRSVPGAAKIDYTYGTLLRDSDRIIVMADSHLQEFARIASGVSERSVLIPPPPLMPMTAANAESRQRGRNALGLAEADFVFAYFGRLRGGKGLETLLAAFKPIRARHADAKLAIIGGVEQQWIAGGGWTPDHLHALARTLGIAESVVWSGEYAWDSDIGSTYLRGADVAILPFDYGVDLNNSSFAAVAAHGLPTITTRGAATDEGVFEDGENVFLCPPCDPVATAAAMERLIQDPVLRQRLRSGVEALARERFSWDMAIDRTIGALSFPPAGRTR